MHIRSDLIGVAVFNKITFKRTRSLSNAACFKHDNNVCACVVSALILLPVKEAMALTLACSLINSRLDYCNALLYGALVSISSKLQRVQNNAAHVVLI